MKHRFFSPPLPRPGDHLRWGGLLPGTDALALAMAARAHPGMVAVVSGDSAAAERLEDELRFFLGNDTRSEEHTSELQSH